MKILITGSNGQLGNELQKIIATGTAEIGSVSDEIKTAEVFAVDIDKLDITNLLINVTSDDNDGINFVVQTTGPNQAYTVEGTFMDIGITDGTGG